MCVCVLRVCCFCNALCVYQMRRIEQCLHRSIAVEGRWDAMPFSLYLCCQLTKTFVSLSYHFVPTIIWAVDLKVSFLVLAYKAVREGETLSVCVFESSLLLNTYLF